MDHRDSQALSVLSSAGFGQAKLQELDDATRDKLAAMASGQGDRRKTIEMILAETMPVPKVVIEQPIELDAVQPLVSDGE